MFFDRNISNRRVMFNSGPLDAQSILVACLPHHIFISSFFLLGVDINVINSRVQLRNLLRATSKHDVYLMQNYLVMHWSILLQKGKEVLNVAKRIIPTFVRSSTQLIRCFSFVLNALDMSGILFLCRSVLDFQLNLSPKCK